MDNTESHTKGDTSWTPEGFVEVIGPNGQHYLVPEFYAPALQNDIDISVVFESPVFCLFWQFCSWHIAIYFFH